MVSPARAHFLRVSAATASASAAAGQQLDCSEYELMLLKLAEDGRRLKGIQSMEAKAQVKRELLPDYAPWVDGVLAAGKGAQDAVLMTVMVWRIDAGDYAGALDIAAYALLHDLVLPDRYARTTATLVAEEMADAAKRARDGKEAFDVDLLEQTLALTAAHDMPDEVRAKLHKEIGLLYAAQTQGETDLALLRLLSESALENLRRAMQLSDKAGVKKDIERLERTLAKDAAPATGAG
jgi:hypothetical protein